MADRRGVPRPTELIYLPKPSWLPLIAAAGIAVLIAGIFAGWVYSVIGAVVGLIAIVAWIRDARTQVERLPLEQEPAAAVLPAVPLRRPPRAES